MIMTHREKAIELFTNGYNCAQSVLCAYCDITGLDHETAKRMSSSFGGGMGKLREACGAVTGGFAVLGLLYGGYDVNDNSAKSEHYARVRALGEAFKEIHGTINCEALLVGIANAKGSDPAERTPEYYRVRPCARFVGEVCDLLDRMISETKTIENA
ncbi:MAG: C_GCAxxG_C_C family protein [Clostridia bacterium]|nr:C_GCAxxG_C_C family protein [Clostridia bacterium]MBO5913741.1 C_GCAxxG_C_C family protein [Clostridia bacterium]